MRRKLFAALACAAAVAAVSASSAAAGAKTECSGFYSDTTLKGGVVVNDGDGCTLVNVTVVGGLTVNGGPDGAYLDLEGSTVNGGLSVSGGSFPAELIVENSTVHGGWSMTGNILTPGYFCGNNVDGGLTVNNVNTSFFDEITFPISFGELNAGCAGGRIDGGATFTNNNSAGVELDGYRVSGGVTFANDTGFNEIEATTVKGSASCDVASNVQNDQSGPPPVNNANSYTGPNNGCPA